MEGEEEACMRSSRSDEVACLDTTLDGGRAPSAVHEDALPPELWCEVFTHLSTREGLGLVSFVCRRWRVLYLSRALLRFHIIPPALIALRARSSPSIDSTDSHVAGAGGDSGSAGMSQIKLKKKAFRVFITKLKDETSALASLSFSPFHPATLAWLSNQPGATGSSSPSPASSPPSSPQALSAATSGNMWVNDKFMRKCISGGFRSLTELDLTNCRLLTAACLPHLPRSLLRLNLRGCRNIIDPSFSHSSATQLFGTASPSSSPPRTLNSVYDTLLPPLVDEEGNVNDDASLPIIASSPTTVIMDFSSVPVSLLSRSTSPPTSPTFSSASTSSSTRTRTRHSLSGLPPRLEVLSFAYCWGLRDEMLVVGSLPVSLRKLSLHDCKRLTSQGMLHLAALTQLEVLDLAYCSTAVTDEVLDAILPAFSRLRELDLSYCKNISPSGLHHLSRLTELVTLDLVFCKKLSPIIFDFLPPTIRNLSLAYCFFMKNKGNVALPFPPELRKLNLAGCELLSDGALSEVSERVPHLQHLNIAECYRVSDVGLGYLTSCRELETLDISYCNITDTGMLELLPPSLRVLTLRSIFNPNKSRDNLGNRSQKLTPSIKVGAIEKLLKRIDVNVSNVPPSQKLDYRFTQPW